MLISQQNIIPKYYTNSIPKYFTIFLNIILLILETLQKSDHSGVQTKRRRGKKTKRIDIVMSEQFCTLFWCLYDLHHPQFDDHYDFLVVGVAEGNKH